MIEWLHNYPLPSAALLFKNSQMLSSTNFPMLQVLLQSLTICCDTSLPSTLNTFTLFSVLSGFTADLTYLSSGKSVSSALSRKETLPPPNGGTSGHLCYLTASGNSGLNSLSRLSLTRCKQTTFSLPLNSALSEDLALQVASYNLSQPVKRPPKLPLVSVDAPGTTK